jgi:hypothetical protein
MKIFTNYIKTVRITNAAKTSLDNLAKSEAIKEKPELFYCNGFVFSIQYNEALAEKLEEDTLYLDSFVYAQSGKIDSVMWNGYSIEIIDYTGFPVFEKIVKGLKKK